jgi:hypothetical protein
MGQSTLLYFLVQCPTIAHFLPHFNPSLPILMTYEAPCCESHDFRSAEALRFVFGRLFNCSLVLKSSANGLGAARVSTLAYYTANNANKCPGYQPHP